MNKVTQVNKIVSYCKANNNQITQREALLLGIYRLASRISDMKRMGYWIAVEMIEVENADGSKSRVARYEIVKYLGNEVYNVATNV